MWKETMPNEKRSSPFPVTQITLKSSRVSVLGDELKKQPYYSTNAKNSPKFSFEKPIEF
jgi:hypothetical protein